MSTKARRARAKHAPTRKFNPVPWLIAVGVVALVVGMIVYNQVRSANLPGEQFPNQGHTHIATVDTPHPPYNTNPPTSGWHVANVARAGTYDYELPDQLLVHNLEDGYVVMYYQMGSDEENEARMRELENASRGYRRVVIVPRSNMEATYALTAWRRLDKFDEFDEARVRTFLDAYEGIDNHPRG
ncbi:hypothetical protein BH24DEI1_BH24DEI1_15370 [soil metagenome]|jgi:hypothetical protein